MSASAVRRFSCVLGVLGAPLWVQVQRCVHQRSTAKPVRISPWAGLLHPRSHAGFNGTGPDRFSVVDQEAPNGPGWSSNGGFCSGLEPNFGSGPASFTLM